MKRLLLLLILLSWRGAMAGPAEPTSPQFRLIGIIELPKYTGALLECDRRPPNCCDLPPSYLLLQAGEKADRITVTQVDPKQRTVQFETNAHQSITSLRLDSAGSSNVGHPEIQLRNVPLTEVANLYGWLVKRTLFVAPQIPRSLVTFQTPSTNLAETARFIEKALKTNGVVIIPDGEKFALVVPARMKNTFTPHSASIKTDASKTNEIIGPGEIDLDGVTINQLLDFYMMLVNRTLASDNVKTPENGSVYFKTLNSINREEAIYAVDILFSFHNLKVVPVGKDLARVEWITPPK